MRTLFALLLLLSLSFGNAYSEGIPKEIAKETAKETPEQKEARAKTVAAMSQKIRKTWHKQLKGYHADHDEKTVVDFLMTPTGVEDLKIKQSSGNPVMDNHCLEAIKKAAPFKFTKGFPNQKSQPVSFTFDYNAHSSHPPTSATPQLPAGTPSGKSWKARPSEGTTAPATGWKSRRNSESPSEESQSPE